MMHLRARLLFALALSLLGSAFTPAAAQGTGAIRGVIFDSLSAGRPLENAEVWLAGSARTARTDAKGQFAFDSLAAGQYKVTFFHPALEGLGVTAPVQEVTVAPGQVAQLRFDTPSPQTVYAALCGPTADKLGLLVGRLYREGTTTPVPRAEIAASWTMWTLAKGGMRQAPREMSTRTDEGGAFVLCAIPGDVPVALRAQATDGSAASQEISLDESVFTFRTMELPSVTAPVAVPALETRLDGQVRTAGGKPVAGAQVLAIGTDLVATTDREGRYTLRGLAPGRVALETRALGYRPVRSIVNVGVGQGTRLVTTFDEKVVVLSTLRVLGRPAPLSTTGFDERRRTGAGYYMTRTDIDNRKAYSVNDLFTGLPGVEVRMQGFGAEVVFGRAMGQYGVMANQCTPIWYVDGVRFRAMESPDDDASSRAVRPTGLDAIMRPADIEGIEVYKNVASAPPQYQPLDSSCGVILVWTRRRPGS